MRHRVTHTVLLLAFALTAIPAQRSWGQTPRDRAPFLSPEQRRRLEEMAVTPTLPGWQREFVASLVGTEPLLASDPSPPDDSPSPTNTQDGAWSEIVMPPRSSHTSIYDPVRDRMVVFGGSPGSDGSYFSANVWTFSFSGSSLLWTQWTPAGIPPQARSGHAAIYDPVRDRMVVFGGFSGTGPYNFFNDVWTLTLSGTPTWQELEVGATLPVARSEPSAIYDPVRDRMLVFGGHTDISTFDDVWALTFSETPTWTELAPVGLPDPGSGFNAIYDPVRDRMIIVGMGFYNFLTDVWALELSSTPAWTELAANGIPTQREGTPEAIYDPVGDRMVLYGGSNLNDVWGLSLSGTPTWTNLTPANNMNMRWRVGHTAIYDPVRERVVVFGGRFNGPINLNDVWGLQLSTTPAWQKLTPGVNPPVTPTYAAALAALTALYDPTPLRDRMVVAFCGSALNEVWTLTLNGDPAWRQLATSGTPPPLRHGHSLIGDRLGDTMNSDRDRMLVFGGRSTGNSPTFNDVWALRFPGVAPTWSQITPAGAPPPARYEHTAVLDPLRERMVVFGGHDAGTTFADTWALSMVGIPTWTELPVAPGARMSHTAIYDPIRDRMVVFGGRSGNVFLNDVWALELSGSPAWSELAPGGAPPLERAQHTSIYDPVRDRMVVFGGVHDSKGEMVELNDVWALSLSGTPSWSMLNSAEIPPSPRSQHTAIYDSRRDQMVVFGRNAPTDLGNSVWALAWNATTGVPDEALPAAAVRLLHAWPNPATASVAFRLDVPQRQFVSVRILDLSGRCVRTLTSGSLDAGVHSLKWDTRDEDGRTVAAGVYFCTAMLGTERLSRTIAVVH